MTEQSRPKDLVSWAVGVEDSGFDFEVCSDHYSPWRRTSTRASPKWRSCRSAATTNANSLTLPQGHCWRSSASSAETEPRDSA